MITTRTPLRISFAGGGTDIPYFYKKYGGEVISTTIDKYVTVKVHNADDFGESGILSAVLDRKTQKMVDACKRITDVDDVMIEIESDAMPRSGLGGSSALVVGLIYALEEYSAQRGKDIFTPWTEDLAAAACEVEINRLGNPIGRQDQYAAAYGGFNRIYFDKDGTVRVNRIQSVTHKLQSWLLLFYTGDQRQANPILRAQQRRENDEILLKMRSQVDRFHDAYRRGDMGEIGLLLHEAWGLKKSLSSEITHTALDAIYDRAILSGANGGKLLGAGGGGHFLFSVPPEDQLQFIEKMQRLGLLHVPFKFETKGTHIERSQG